VLALLPLTSTAADAAFDAGVMVIAAAGNAGPVVGSIRSPGNVHKTMGVGATPKSWRFNARPAAA
jgi:subtilisin family serine protease